MTSVYCHKHNQTIEGVCFKCQADERMAKENNKLKIENNKMKNFLKALKCTCEDGKCELCKLVKSLSPN